jgi:hypothetical protein
MDKTPEHQMEALNRLFLKLSEQQWAKKIIQDLSEKIALRSRELYEFETQRNYFLVENFRETCSEPIASSQPSGCFNLLGLYKTNINKELRRVVWVKCLMQESSKLEFFRHDHRVVPYNLTEELSIHLLNLST